VTTRDWLQVAEDERRTVAHLAARIVDLAGADDDAALHQARGDFDAAMRRLFHARSMANKDQRRDS